MEKFLKVLIVVGVLVIGYAFFWPSSVKKKDSKERIVRERLIEKGLFRLVEKEEAVLAQVDDLKVDRRVLDKDPVYRALQEEAKEVTLVQVIRQWGLVDSKPIVFSIKAPQRSLSEILNQYDLNGFDESRIQFKMASTSGVARVGGREVSQADLEPFFFHRGRVETRIYFRVIELVKSRIFTQMLTAAAQKESISTQEYMQKYVLNGAKYLKNKDIGQSIEAYIREKLLTEPMTLYWKPPHIPIDLKPDWTPSLGDTTSKQKVFIFSDFYSQWSRDIFKELPKLSRDFPSVYFAFRPIFPKQDRFQNLLAEMGFCIWAQSPQNYFPFLSRAVQVPEGLFEKDMYGIIKTLKVPMAPIKECFYKQSHKNIVDYHQEYAQYLGLSSGPVVFMDGLVFGGEMTGERLRKSLKEAQ